MAAALIVDGSAPPVVRSSGATLTARFLSTRYDMSRGVVAVPAFIKFAANTNSGTANKT